MSSLLLIFLPEKDFTSVKKNSFLLLNVSKSSGMSSTVMALLWTPIRLDSILNWKIPTNRELLAGFLGAVGYLASGCHEIRNPNGKLDETYQ